MARGRGGGVVGCVRTHRTPLSTRLVCLQLSIKKDDNNRAIRKIFIYSTIENLAEIIFEVFIDFWPQKLIPLKQNLLNFSIFHNFNLFASAFFSTQRRLEPIAD